ncbi:unnamed protein product [Blepharisma stoltei]|uniref:Uncharacterized protein n=1 Tax=Blepharisma stoltei TaxID=1481888 RepID=A0AAU9JTQ4_9CILI|nr:unnamed protein product [Blepharisma stoltei]
MLACVFRTFSSKRSQLGLWHAKDVRSGFTYSFSHEKTKRTIKPNVFDKSLWSNILKRHLTISVSSTAWKKIKFAGGLDNYILKTDPKLVRSKFGETLKTYLQKKLEDPNWQVPYIKGSRQARKTKLDKDKFQSANMWYPIETRYVDHSEEFFDRYQPNPPPRPEIADDDREEVPDAGAQTFDIGPVRQKKKKGESELEKLIKTEMSENLKEQEEDTTVHEKSKTAKIRRVKSKGNKEVAVELSKNERKEKEYQEKRELKAKREKEREKELEKKEREQAKKARDQENKGDKQ